MDLFNTSHSINESIQLAVTPVFLLVAIGSFLNVMTQRLARVVDRARALEELLTDMPNEPHRDLHVEELRGLDRRITHAQRAITASAVSALLIAFQVAILFLSDLAGFNGSQAIAILFILSMTGIILALFFFLMEIRFATRTLKIRAELLTA